MLWRQFNSLVSRRCISGTSALMQQQYGRQGFQRTFDGTFQSPQAESIEESEMLIESSQARPIRSPFTSIPRVGANNTPSATGTMSMEIKAAINPFPEETTQEYANPSLFMGASDAPFSREVTDILQAELNPAEVEIKPDGALYLPESRYRKVLFRAFGAGGWSLIPRGAHSLAYGVLSREYALFCNGRFVSQVRGHASIQGFSNPAMASEVVRSNALMRVCKDLGVGNELWDSTYCTAWRENRAIRNIANGKVRWQKKDNQSEY